MFFISLIKLLILLFKMKNVDIYDYAENENEEEKSDRGMQIKIQGKDDVYVIINQIKINAYSKTYSAIRIKGNKSKDLNNKNIKQKIK